MPLLLLLSCAEPFEVSRHDLGPFRVAAVGVAEGVLRAEVWSGQGMGHASAPTLQWYVADELLGEGHAVLAPAQGVEVVLVATSAGGEVAEARFTSRERPDRLGFERLAVESDEELSRESRLSWPAQPLQGSAEADGVVRFQVLGSSYPGAVRWMTAGGYGTLLELDADSGDAFASEIVFSEEQELLSREELGPTMTHHLALALDGEGGNDWIWLDAAFGLDQPLLRHRGRLLPVEAQVDAGLVAVTLEKTNDLDGLMYLDALAVEDLSEQDALDCAPPDEPFLLVWVSSGRCSLDELDGARVVLETW